METTLRLSCPENYSLSMVCHTHGWRQLRPFSWDGEREALGYVLETGHQSVDLRITQEGAHMRVAVTGEKSLGMAEEGALLKSVVTMLALDRDIAEIRRLAEATSPAFEGLVKSGAGRILVAPTAWENAVKTLFTTNCSWLLTRKMAEKLCSAAFTTPAPSGAFPFPSPAAVNRYSADELRALAPVGYRAAYLKALAEVFVADPGFENDLSGGMTHGEMKRRVAALKGFGEYARIHLMTLHGFCGEIPVDSVVRGYMKTVHGVEDVPPFLAAHYGDWGEYRWWKFKMESMINNTNFP